jgi:hypothetical protein
MPYPEIVLCLVCTEEIQGHPRPVHVAKGKPDRLLCDNCFDKRALRLLKRRMKS